MAQEFYTRIINKHDTEANWNNNSSFIPKQGEIIIYDIDSNYNFQRIKIGDGVTTVNNLPFINIADARFDEIMSELEEIKGLAATGGSLQEISATPGDVLNGKTYNDSEGKVQAGTMLSKAAATYGAKTSDQTIAAGQYLSGTQTIKKVEQTNLSAGNIIKGTNVKITSNGSNLWNITGTATFKKIFGESCNGGSDNGNTTATTKTYTLTPGKYRIRYMIGGYLYAGEVINQPLLYLNGTQTSFSPTQYCYWVWDPSGHQRTTIRDEEFTLTITNNTTFYMKAASLYWNIKFNVVCHQVSEL